VVVGQEREKNKPYEEEKIEIFWETKAGQKNRVLKEKKKKGV